MSDLIDRQAAIDVIRDYLVNKVDNEPMQKACQLAIKALSAEPHSINLNQGQSSDTISREAAIDALDDAEDGFGYLTRDWTEVLMELPPVQPEIIWCKDCKHRDPEDKKCDCGHDILWQLPRRDDWYCADAERREVTE